MASRTRTSVALALVGALASAGLALSSQSPALASICPTVDPVTHVVKPVPSPGVDWS